eukprot:TRINITY_DN2637_c0_g1_i6.p1 TRINITY_DN2637_c0_g1~~TRINITY_DN2637_c0_g1_i6.p1  ORF type:complete len:125 (+),score=2.35 TRINITY_DN2637_c0_g1_i6:220-594(+)
MLSQIVSLICIMAIMIVYYNTCITFQPLSFNAEVKSMLVFILLVKIVQKLVGVEKALGKFFFRTMKNVKEFPPFESISRMLKLCNRLPYSNISTEAKNNQKKWCIVRGMKVRESKLTTKMYSNY